MSRRKPLAHRGATGRIHTVRSELMSPTEVRRLVDSAATGLRDPSFGTMLGQLHVRGKINAAQFSAGKRWMELTVAYSEALRSPQPPRTVQLDYAGGMSPDSITHEKEIRRHERTTAAWLDGRHALRLAGATVEKVVESVCVHDCAPAGFTEMQALLAGLSALNVWWTTKKR